jgi:hypothetical protein
VCAAELDGNMPLLRSGTFKTRQLATNIVDALWQVSTLCPLNLPHCLPISLRIQSQPKHSILCFQPFLGTNSSVVSFLFSCLGRPSCPFSSPKFPEKAQNLYFSPILRKEAPQSFNSRGFGISSPHLRATGLPPHIAIVLELQGIKSGLENLAPTLVEEIGQNLEKNGAAAANITPEGLKVFLQNTLAQIIPQYVQTQAPAAVAPEEPVQSGYGLYAWGGSLHRLPEDFKFPDVTLASGFRLWYQGSTEENLPPFRTLEPSDFSVKNERKRLSDWKYLMTSLTEALDEDDMVTDCEPENFSLDLLNSQFKLAMERIPVNEKKKRTRPSEWKVVTAVSVPITI